MVPILIPERQWLQITWNYYKGKNFGSILSLVSLATLSEHSFLKLSETLPVTLFYGRFTTFRDGPVCPKIFQIYKIRKVCLKTGINFFFRNISDWPFSDWRIEQLNSELLEYALDMWESLVQTPVLIVVGNWYKTVGYFAVYVLPSFL